MPTDSQKTDIFRYMHVRPPQKISPVLLEEKYIEYELGPSPFFTQLTGELSASYPRGAVEAKAQTASGTTTIYANINQAYANFSNFDRISDFLFENLENVTKTELKNKIQSEIGVSLSAFVQNGQYVPKKLKVWDTIFYLEITSSNDGFLRDLMMVLRICRLIELLNDNSPLVEFNAGIKTQAEANIVLPKPLFPLPKRVKTETNSHSEIEPAPDLTKVKEDIEKLKAARTDVTRVYELQKSNVRSTKLDFETYSKKLVVDPLPGEENRPTEYTEAEKQEIHQEYLMKPLPFTIEDRNFSKLAATTQTVLATLGYDVNNMVVQDLLETIDEELARNYALLQSGQSTPKLIRAGSVLVRIDPQPVTAESKGDGPLVKEVSPPYVQPLGIGDMLVVREQLLKYEEGEIAHIENILATERKLRSVKSLTRTETVIETETFNETSLETDTRNSTQFEMAQAMNHASQSANQSASGVSISASYGPVSADAFAQNSAQSGSSQSESQATQVAKEFSDSARERIIESVRELRITSSLQEIETLNEHEIDNTAPDSSHKIGHYHWIDKKYLNQVYKIGKRLMYEFLIPEPAAFYIHSLVKQPHKEEYPEVPVHPFKYHMEELNEPLSHKLIERTNYDVIAAQAKATGIEPPPQELLYLGSAMTNQNLEGWNLDSYNDSIDVPEGYTATAAAVVVSFSIGNDRYVKVKVGAAEFATENSSEGNLILQNITGKVPISVHSGKTYYAVNVVVECALTKKAYAEWQLSVFTKIMQQYQDSVALYNFEVQRIDQEARNAVESKITGYNPERNRIIEKNELKKAAIKFLTASRFDEFDSMIEHFSELGYPDFDFQEAIDEGKFIRFFEQAFEWDNITYFHYPYFWGRKENWLQVLHMEDNDPKFSDFLKAGATRVVVPVRPSFTKAMLHYQSNGEIWAGQDLPDLDDELHLSIVEEIQDSQTNYEGEPVGEPWIVKLPTNLIRLNASTDPELPDHSDELL